MAGYVISCILEPPLSDDSEQEESLIWSIAAKDRAASSLAIKGPASKGPPKTADRRRGQLSVAVFGHTCAHVAGVAGNPRIQWDFIEDEDLHAEPRSNPKAIGTPSLRRVGPARATDKVKNFLQAGPIGPGGGRELPAARPWRCPD